MVIHQDSVLELSRPDSVTTTLSSGGSAPGPRLSRSMSRDTGLDAGGGSEAMLLRRQVELLQEEVTRLRLKGEEPSRERVEQGRKLSNGSVGDMVKSDKVSQSVGESRPSRLTCSVSRNGFWLAHQFQEIYWT